MEVIFDEGAVSRVEHCKLFFSETVIGHTGQIVPESASQNERLEAMRFVRDALNAELAVRHSRRISNAMQFENMTKNIKPGRSLYFVR